MKLLRNKIKKYIKVISFIILYSMWNTAAFEDYENRNINLYSNLSSEKTYNPRKFVRTLEDIKENTLTDKRKKNNLSIKCPRAKLPIYIHYMENTYENSNTNSPNDASNQNCNFPSLDISPTSEAAITAMIEEIPSTQKGNNKRKRSKNKTKNSNTNSPNDASNQNCNFPSLDTSPTGEAAITAIIRKNQKDNNPAYKQHAANLATSTSSNKELAKKGKSSKKQARAINLSKLRISETSQDESKQQSNICDCTSSWLTEQSDYPNSPEQLSPINDNLSAELADPAVAAWAKSFEKNKNEGSEQATTFQPQTIYAKSDPAYSKLEIKGLILPEITTPKKETEPNSILTEENQKRQDEQNRKLIKDKVDSIINPKTPPKDKQSHVGKLVALYKFLDQNRHYLSYWKNLK